MRRAASRILLAPAALAAVGAVLLAGCGGGGATSGQSAEQILRKTFGANKSVHSGRLDLDLELNLQGVRSLNGPVSIKVAGPFQSGGDQGLPRFNFTLSLSANGTAFSAGAVSTGDRGYLSFLGTNYLVDAATFNQFRTGYEQARANANRQSKSTLGSFGVDPVRWLTNPRKVGSETVGGASTTHITAGIDVSKLVGDLATLLAKARNVPGVSRASLTPAQQAAITRSVRSATLDVYSGTDDEILRRMTVAVTLAQGTVSFDLLIADLNRGQTITAPSNAQPLAALLSALGSRSGSGGLGSLLGSSGAAGSSGSAGSGSAPSAGATGATGGASSARYLQCLQAAGQDLAKAQRCAALIGK